MFIDGAKLFVTKKQADVVMQISGTASKGMKINNDYYAFCSISKILTIDEYYRQFPNKIPGGYGVFPKQDKKQKLSDSQSRQKQIRRTEQILEGLNKFIKNKNNPLKALKLEKTIQQSLTRLKNGEILKDNTQTTRFITV